MLALSQVTLPDFEGTVNHFCHHVPCGTVEIKNNNKNPVCNCKLY